MNEFCFLIALMTVVVQESVSGGKPEVKIWGGGGGEGLQVNIFQNQKKLIDL